MTQEDLALRIPGLRPGETPFLQPLGTDPESAPVPDEDLQPIALTVAEQEKVTAQRLTRQSIPDQAEGGWQGVSESAVSAKVRPEVTWNDCLTRRS